MTVRRGKVDLLSLTVSRLNQTNLWVDYFALTVGKNKVKKPAMDNKYNASVLVDLCLETTRETFVRIQADLLCRVEGVSWLIEGSLSRS